MRYIITFFWAFLLTQMVNFILNSLAGGGPLNFWIGVILAVIITLTVFVLDILTKMSRDTQSGNEN
ncbi:YjzD family protein [Jeotgalicoccus huakuii]|uniref:YjzD family protein n=1 Tax=Jeotgalicoccus TaxID=227979 RepID=UPI00040C40A6|nr:MULTISPECIES: YjzD family protein [Jeotgalicoccus]MCK1976367.1 YjzD family protein [Jeotgalicoccus huakuii]QQD85921.1 YjzD family protein [Jeotgalicoccus sp. ATCC 8456]